MQYGNPYFAQPFQQIQPYQDRLAQLQNSLSAGNAIRTGTNSTTNATSATNPHVARTDG